MSLFSLTGCFVVVVVVVVVCVCVCCLFFDTGGQSFDITVSIFLHGDWCSQIQHFDTSEQWLDIGVSVFLCGIVGCVSV